MKGFQYTHGDRPLEGYAIQRAVGRGGFGEVYYALSDGGREVALKAIQGYEQIELRGVSQCMNLKSPHLVTIFDIKYNEKDRPFVIMEYVSGPSLRDLLNDAPSGIGEQKAAFFLREIAKGLTYLHDRGIVHRDLKPGNIFYEDGYVKIGDYGLSKAISVSQHSGQTITVGTVHYMAPEIGQGKYDRSIDIYALGVLLYEMLTGQVPFFGTSHGEILMKHLMAEPELEGIAEPFATVIRKAMAKEPADRYPSVQEMVEAVFGAEHIQQSVSHFSPDSLSMVAQRVAQKVAVGGPGSSADVTGQLNADRPAGDADSDVWQGLGRGIDEFGRQVGTWTDHFGERMGRVGERIGRRFSGRQRHATPAGEPAAIPVGDRKNDPINSRQRNVLMLVTAAVTAVGTGLLGQTRHVDAVLVAMFCFFMICGGSTGVTMARYRLLRHFKSENSLPVNLICGGLGGLFVVLLSSVFLAKSGGVHRYFGATYFPVLAALLPLDWKERTQLNRDERIDLGEALVAAGLGWIINIFCGAPTVLVCGTLAGISLAVQALAPFDPAASQARKAAESAVGRARRWWKTRHAPDTRARPHGSPPPVPHGAAAQHAGAFGTPGMPYAHGASVWPTVRSVPVFVRALFLLGFVGLLCLGLMVLIWAGIESFKPDEFVVVVSVGVGSLLFSLFCLIKAMQGQFRGWWRNFIKPFLLLTCIQTIISASLVLGNMQLKGDETLAALFLIIFPSILFLVLLCIPSSVVEAMFGTTMPSATSASPLPGISNRRRLWAMLLATGAFAVPLCGLQRFYVGKIGTGILWLCTFGFFFIGQVIDIIMIAAGRFTDHHGRRLVVWQSFDELRGAPPESLAGRAGAGAAPYTEPQAPAWGQTEPVACAPGSDNDDPSPMPDTEAPSPGQRIEVGSRVFIHHSPISLIFSALGSIILLAAFLLGLCVAVDIPAIVNAGLPDPGLNRETTELFGYAGWPDLVNRVSRVVSILLMIAAAILITLGRRRAGVAHVSRATLGIIGLSVTLAALQSALAYVKWPLIAAMVDSEQFGPAIETFLDQVHDRNAIVAGVLLLVSNLLLAWPARKRAQPSPTTTDEGGQRL